MKIAFIGFGEAARAFVGTLRERPGLTFTAYDILLGTDADADMRAAAANLGVVLAADPARAVTGADWIVSAVTAADSLDAAASVATHLGAEQLFVDINSVSPGRKRETAALVERAGATYLDMAVMAPVHPRGHHTPVLTAGPAAQQLAARLKEMGFSGGIAGPKVGDATAIKMIRSLFVKGMEAVTVQALLASRAAGCFDAVYDSLSGSFPHLGWPDFPGYQLERVTRHGVRRAAEMRESAVSMEELGQTAGRDLATAIAGLQDEIGRLGFRPVGDLDADIAALLEAKRR